MKKSIIYIILSILPIVGFSQTSNKIGLAYYGHTLTHPGIALEYEMEFKFSENSTLPLRLDLGFYSHQRYHKGIFFEINTGFRRYYKSNIFLEQGFGIGALQTIVNGDGTFKVDTDGSVSKASGLNPLSFMPSINFGVGYRFTMNKQETLVWLRPKLAWQFPHKTSSLIHPAIAFGFTYSI